VSIIDLVEAEEGDVRLESVAKDFSPLWPVTVESLDTDTIIGANVSHTLLSEQPANKSTQMISPALSGRLQPFLLFRSTGRDQDDSRTRRLLEPRRSREQVYHRYRILMT
jgi:hypothetical protein